MQTYGSYGDIHCRKKITIDTVNHNNTVIKNRQILWSAPLQTETRTTVKYLKKVLWFGEIGKMNNCWTPQWITSCSLQLINKRCCAHFVFRSSFHSSIPPKDDVIREANDIKVIEFPYIVNNCFHSYLRLSYFRSMHWPTDVNNEDDVLGCDWKAFRRDVMHEVAINNLCEKRKLYLPVLWRQVRLYMQRMLIFPIHFSKCTSFEVRWTHTKELCQIEYDTNLR